MPLEIVLTVKFVNWILDRLFGKEGELELPQFIDLEVQTLHQVGTKHRRNIRWNRLGRNPNTTPRNGRNQASDGQQLRDWPYPGRQRLLMQ